MGNSSNTMENGCLLASQKAIYQMTIHAILDMHVGGLQMQYAESAQVYKSTANESSP